MLARLVLKEAVVNHYYGALFCPGRLCLTFFQPPVQDSLPRLYATHRCCSLSSLNQKKTTSSCAPHLLIIGSLLLLTFRPWTDSASRQSRILESHCDQGRGRIGLPLSFIARSPVNSFESPLSSSSSFRQRLRSLWTCHLHIFKAITNFDATGA